MQEVLRTVKYLALETQHFSRQTLRRQASVITIDRRPSCLTTSLDRLLFCPHPTPVRFRGRTKKNEDLSVNGGQELINLAFWAEIVYGPARQQGPAPGMRVKRQLTNRSALQNQEGPDRPRGHGGRLPIWSSCCADAW